MRHLTRYQLSAHLDGALEGVSSDLVRVHLDLCPDCRARQARMRAVTQVLAAQLTHEPEDRFFDQLGASLECEIKARGGRRDGAFPAALEQLLVEESERQARDEWSAIGRLAAPAGPAEGFESEAAGPMKPGIVGPRPSTGAEQAWLAADEQAWAEVERAARKRETALARAAAEAEQEALARSLAEARAAAEAEQAAREREAALAQAAARQEALARMASEAEEASQAAASAAACAEETAKAAAGEAARAEAAAQAAIKEAARAADAARAALREAGRSEVPESAPVGIPEPAPRPRPESSPAHGPAPERAAASSRNRSSASAAMAWIGVPTVALLFGVWLMIANRGGSGIDEGPAHTASPAVTVMTPGPAVGTGLSVPSADTAAGSRRGAPDSLPSRRLPPPAPIRVNRTPSAPARPAAASSASHVVAPPSASPATPEAPPVATRGDLCGQVADEGGAPIVGAEVLLADVGLAVVTVRDGRFCISAPTGARNVSVSAPGFQAVQRVVTVGPRTPEIRVSLIAVPVPQAPPDSGGQP